MLPCVARGATAVVGLRNHIPEIVDISIGVTFTDRGKGYTYGLSVRLRSKDDLTKYQAHPEHLRVKDEVMKPLMAAPAPVALDWESPRHCGAGSSSGLHRVLSKVLPARAITPLACLGLGFTAGWLAKSTL